MCADNMLCSDHTWSLLAHMLQYYLDKLSHLDNFCLVLGL